MVRKHLVGQTYLDMDTLKHLRKVRRKKRIKEYIFLVLQFKQLYFVCTKIMRSNTCEHTKVMEIHWVTYSLELITLILVFFGAVNRSCYLSSFTIDEFLLVYCKGIDILIF